MDSPKYLPFVRDFSLFSATNLVESENEIQKKLTENGQFIQFSTSYSWLWNDLITFTVFSVLKNGFLQIIMFFCTLKM